MILCPQSFDRDIYIYTEESNSGLLYGPRERLFRSVTCQAVKHSYNWQRGCEIVPKHYKFTSITSNYLYSKETTICNYLVKEYSV